MKDVEIHDFAKSYGDTVAVDGVSLEVNSGEIFGLIGPDGAGKSTLFRAITCLIQPDSGRIRVLDLDTSDKTSVEKIRDSIGYMPQRFSLYQDLSVRQNLDFFSDLFGVPKAEKVKRMERLYGFSKLEPFEKRKAGALSGGMKQKLALMCALIHRPRLLVLDEPTFGVDPVSRKELWDILTELNSEGTTVLASTAYMDETAYCDRIALMHRGRIMRRGTVAGIAEEWDKQVLELDNDNAPKLLPEIEKMLNFHSVRIIGSFHRVFMKKSDMPLPKNLAEFVVKPTVEDIFLDTIEES